MRKITLDSELTDIEYEYELEIGENIKNDTESSDEEEQFFDALPTFSEDTPDTDSFQETILVEDQTKPLRKRRVEIPHKLKSSSFNVLFTVLRNSIGKDLTRVAFPATFFSEPITFLQRQTEFLEYSYLLDLAAACTDSLEQMTYVTAFSISIYNLHVDRNSKPFNPLLNETFECDRTEDFKWRSFSEQTTHHPPQIASVIVLIIFLKRNRLILRVLL